MNNYDVIVIGAGLAGLTAAYELAERGYKVLLIEKEKFLGGRTASWDDNGMLIESGFHRHIGFYKQLPKILKKVNVKINDIVMWEKDLEIKLKNNDSIILGIAPFYSPIKFIKGMIGNNHILSLKDKLSLVRFFMGGFKDYLINPKKLDTYSVKSYARKYNVSNKTLDYILTPFSTGIFFLPPNQYSAKVFFGVFAPGIPRTPKLRIGAYLGGMGTVLADPIGKGFKKLGGVIKLNCEVINIIIKNNKVIGVELNNKGKLYAHNIVLATDIVHAKKLLKKHRKYNDWIEPILKMPTMSAITIQFDLKKPILPLDRTTFAPLTILTSFTEQSRSTFKHVPGRLSIIISDPDKYMELNDGDLFRKVIIEAKKIYMNFEEDIIDYRVVRHKNKFYHLGPNHDSMRPVQDTPINGLILAGDYTRQPLYATMEGAVISGIKAAKHIYKINKK